MYALIITVIELTSSIDKSGRLAVCQNETIVYRCQSINAALVWIVDVQGEWPIAFAANDTKRFVEDPQGERRFFAYLQNEMDNYLLSYLAVPYFPDWNKKMVVQCNDGLGSSKNLSYIIAGKEEK